MKLIEAIYKVDRSDSNSADADIDIFCSALGIEHYFGWSNAFTEKIKGYYLFKWLCTDTRVGGIVYYMDDEPVAVSSQNARKSDVEIEFLSKETAEKVRNYILSLLEYDEPSYDPILNPEEELGEFYNVNYAGELLVKEGFVKGKSCTVIKEHRGQYGCGQTVDVQYENGDIETINVADFKIPYHITK